MAVPSNNITGMSVNGHDVGCYRSNFKGSVSAAVQLWMTTSSTAVLHFACQHCMRRTACISICSVHYITFAVSLHFTHAHFTAWMWPQSDVLDVCVDSLHLPATTSFTVSSIRSASSHTFHSSASRWVVAAACAPFHLSASIRHMCFGYAYHCIASKQHTYRLHEGDLLGIFYQLLHLWSVNLWRVTPYHAYPPHLHVFGCLFMSTMGICSRQLSCESAYSPCLHHAVLFLNYTAFTSNLPALLHALSLLSAPFRVDSVPCSGLADKLPDQISGFQIRSVRAVRG